MIYCNVSCILSSVSVSDCLSSGLICDGCSSCCTWRSCTVSSGYIDTYILIVINICSLVCNILCKSQFCCSVIVFCSNRSRSCRLVKLCTSSHFIVVYDNISCVVSLIIVVNMLCSDSKCTVLITWHCYQSIVRDTQTVCIIWQSKFICTV